MIFASFHQGKEEIKNVFTFVIPECHCLESKNPFVLSLSENACFFCH